jgi:hypothetical protein
MMSISKMQLKQTIDQLDNRYLELAYKILQQFPQISDRDVLSEEIPLEGSVLRYSDPTEPVAINDWNVLQ